MDLHPSGGEGRNANGKLRVLNSKFGHGWVVAGYHPSFRIPARRYAAGVTAVTVCKIEIHPQTNLDFWEIDGLCVQSDPCIIRSREEQEELNALKKGMKHDPVKKVINVSYPVKSDPSTCLVNNREAVLSFQKNQETIMLKDGSLALYNKEFQKFLDPGVPVPLTREEINSYTGPLF